MHPEVISHLPSFEAFARWYPKHHITGEQLSLAVERIRQHGIQSTYFGAIAASDISVQGSDYREQLIAKGLNARQRALLECMVTDERFLAIQDPKIYAPEAITPLAMTLKASYRFFVGSEYYQDQSPSHWLYPVMHQDLMNLTFHNDTFDVVLTSDVLEHVPDLSQSLRELARVLKPGGLMFSAHPFTWQAQSSIKARLKDQQIEWLGEPEYHENPAAPDKGSPVFTIPGWDVIDRCREAGFAHAEMILMASTAKGILGSSPPFINILRAYR